MEVIGYGFEMLPDRAAVGSGRVHRARRAAGGDSPAGQGGFTLVEVVMTMVLLSVGLLGLAPLMVAVFQGNRFAQEMSLATVLAEDRMEEIMNHPVYSEITTARFPSEARGSIRQGDQKYRRFSRSVAIVDSLDILGRSLLKSITVVVTWSGMDGSSRDVTLFSRVSRF